MLPVQSESTISYLADELLLIITNNHLILRIKMARAYALPLKLWVLLFDIENMQVIVLSA